jgi:hypothetical protein
MLKTVPTNVINKVTNDNLRGKVIQVNIDSKRFDSYFVDGRGDITRLAHSNKTTDYVVTDTATMRSLIDCVNGEKCYNEETKIEYTFMTTPYTHLLQQGNDETGQNGSWVVVHPTDETRGPALTIEARYIRFGSSGSNINLGNHYCGITMIDDKKNIIDIYAEDILWTFGDGTSISTAYKSKCKIESNNTYNTNTYVSTTSSSATRNDVKYLNIDLNTPLKISEINIARYFSDKRIYYSCSTEYSMDGINWDTLIYEHDAVAYDEHGRSWVSTASKIPSFLTRAHISDTVMHLTEEQKSKIDTIQTTAVDAPTSIPQIPIIDVPYGSDASAYPFGSINGSTIGNQLSVTGPADTPEVYKDDIGVWNTKIYSNTRGPNGGALTDKFLVDSRYDYRISVWVKGGVDRDDPRVYLGAYTYNDAGSRVGITYNNDGDSTTNFYGYYGAMRSTTDGWHLIYFDILSADSEFDGSRAHIRRDSDKASLSLLDYSDDVSRVLRSGKMRPEATNIAIRFYSYYGTVIDAEVDFCGFRCDKLNGYELPINALMNEPLVALSTLDVEGSLRYNNSTKKLQLHDGTNWTDV